ncbi:MAG TPA: hypothetical protein DEQ30_02990 [Porphyromonadaceae bacterium]|nr:hypothetical protein [Porphyromonadaceae bacterium]
MSIKIQTLEGEIFDLPADYIIESTKTNPVFTPKGSQTVPISFPPTGKNKRLTGNAHRIDKADRPEATIKVLVESGPVQQAGLLAIQSASGSLISANIGWDESEMYASMKKTMLPNIPDLPVYSADGATLDEKREQILSHLKDVMNGQIPADYAIFPLILKKETAGENDREYLEIINDTFISTNEEFGEILPSNGSIGGFRAKEHRIINRVYDSEVIPFDVPQCYGMSPFLYVSKVLELIFKSYGFSLENNPFCDHPQLSKLVVLNNTMDAVITGNIFYRDLMPDVSVEEFLNALKNKFGLTYFVNSNTRSVRFSFMRDMFDPNNRDELDLTKYKTDHPTITYRENRQLKLVPNNEIEGAETKSEFYEDFLADYGHQFKDEYLNFEADTRYTLLFLVWNRRYASYRSDLPSPGNFSYLSSDFFGWDKKDKLPYEEITFTDLNLPMFSEDRFEVAYPSMSNYTVLMYLVDYKHKHSDASVSGKSVSVSAATAKLAFAFAWGKSDMESSSAYTLYNYSYASQDNRNWNGELMTDSAGRRYDISLNIQHEDGLFNRFWKQYDAWLRHSGHEVDITIKMSEFELSKIRADRKIMIDNQLYLLEEMRYQMGNSVKPVELKLRAIRLYEPYNLETEQAIASYSPQKYYWRGESVKNPDTEKYLTDQGMLIWIDFFIEGYRSFDEDARSSMIIFPPTEKQYQNQETFVLRYQYEVRWRQNGLDQSSTVTQTVTYYPTQIT